MPQTLSKFSQICTTLFFILFIAFIFLCFLLVPPSLDSAAAQSWYYQQNSVKHSLQEAPRRSFWDKLFGRNKQPSAGKFPPNGLTLTHKTPITIVKNPDARRVLVIGDFTAAALAEALVKAYKDRPDILIRNETESASGLSQDSSYNWITNLKPLIAREKPNLLIIMLGANDKLPINKDTPQEQTEKILKNYQSRIRPFMQNLQTSQAAWIWIGLPPFKEEKLNTDAQSLNHIYKQAAEQSGGHFVTTWDGFVNEKNSFAFSGYDVNGKTVRLRTNDGINFTFAGQYKLAFYAQQAIDLLWGENMEQELTSSAKAGKIFNNRAAPVNPLDIGTTDGTMLAGGGIFRANPQIAHYAAKALFANFPKGSDKTNSAIPNITVAPPLGRADNFRLLSSPQPK